MDREAVRRRIDRVDWYHEFDFGGGLVARSRAAADHGHRAVWAFIRRHLDRVDFRGKSVLDVGAWDGYWSFEAERRGAASVLATDDATQNWADGSGIHLARELLGSKIEVDQGLSVYRLASLGRTFDVILFLGVYYHLHDPFYALAQLRHCCHPGTVVVVDGPVTEGLGEGGAVYNFADHTAEWLPTVGAVRQLVRAAYFAEDGCELMTGSPPAPPPARPGRRWRLGACLDALRGRTDRLREKVAALAPPPPAPRAAVRRMVMTCRPREGAEELHLYPPPFGLHAYDPRFRDYAGADTPRRAA